MFLTYFCLSNYYEKNDSFFKILLSKNFIVHPFFLDYMTRHLFSDYKNISFNTATQILNHDDFEFK